MVTEAFCVLLWWLAGFACLLYWFYKDYKEYKKCPTLGECLLILIFSFVGPFYLIVILGELQIGSKIGKILETPVCDLFKRKS